MRRLPAPVAFLSLSLFLFLSLAVALTASIPAGQAQPASAEHFVDVDGHPFGPGDRRFSVSVKLLGSETSANTELWVLYGESRAAVVAATLAAPGGVARGRCRVGAVNAEGVVSAAFIFPHTDHPRPNDADAAPVAIASGRTVHYKLVKKRGSTELASDLVTFVMPDKLTVASFGDSYASGEGAPYDDGGARWDDELCHRSGNSGQARAVRAYKASHPETAIAFKNVACSGAAVMDGLVNSQDKRGPFTDQTLATRVRPQIEQVADWLRTNSYQQLNIALVSIGGNDVEFAPYVREYFVLPHDLSAPENERARRNVVTNIDEDIPLVYDVLKERFDARFDYDRILVTEYPDPTHDGNGAFCGGGLFHHGECWGLVEAVGSPPAEFKFAYESIVSRLNATIRSKVVGFERWRFLAGTMQRTERHGICNCEEPYFNTVGDSLLLQLDPYGTMHPNKEGHRKGYRPVVLAGLEDAVRAIRIDYALARAREIAAERIRAAARRRTLEAAIATGPVPVLKRPSRQSAVIPAALIEQARQSAAGRPRPTGDDNRMASDERE